MIPVSVQDVVEGVATAQYVFKVGFRKANNASKSTHAAKVTRLDMLLTSADQKYREFGDDVRNLAINLDLLYVVIKRAEQLGESLVEINRFTKPGLGADAASRQVLGDFVCTLNDCRHLLDDEKYFQKYEDFVTSINWYNQIDPEVQKLRERIAFHNIKVISLRHTMRVESSLTTWIVVNLFQALGLVSFSI
jgi:hypothetical protein